MKSFRTEEKGNADGIVDALLEIAAERRRILESMRSALLRGDDAEALERAREIAELPPGGAPMKRAIDEAVIKNVKPSYRKTPEETAHFDRVFEDPALPERLAPVIREIAEERTRILESMRSALLRGDDAEALERAREFTGLPPKRATIPQS